MKYGMILLSILSTVSLSASAVAATAPTKKDAKKDEADPKVKRQLSFDSSQLVEGEIYRPDYAVVTGENPGEGWGVLRLRKSFSDKQATDNQEKKR